MGAICCKVIDLYEDYLRCQPEVGPDGYVKEEELTVMVSLLYAAKIYKQL